MGCFFAISLPPSADSAKINTISANGKQDAARRLEATQGKHGFLCYIFRLSVIIKVLLKQISLYLLSHFRIRIIVLTCPDDKSARNHQQKSCVPAKSRKSKLCEANINSIQGHPTEVFRKIYVPQSKFSSLGNQLLLQISAGNFALFQAFRAELAGFSKRLIKTGKTPW